MKCSYEMLQNLIHFMHKKTTNFVFCFFHCRQLFTISLYSLVYVIIDQGIHNQKKGKKLHNKKEQKNPTKKGISKMNNEAQNSKLDIR